MIGTSHLRSDFNVPSKLAFVSQASYLTGILIFFSLFLLKKSIIKGSNKKMTRASSLPTTMFPKFREVIEGKVLVE